MCLLWATAGAGQVGVPPQVSWEASYDGGVPLDWPVLAIGSAAVDAAGNVYTAGTGAPGGCVVLKHSPAGVLLWSRTPGLGCTALTLDGSDNVYVTGGAHFLGSGPTSTDYKTVKLDSDGATLWTARYTGLGGPDVDRAYALAVDSSGNVVVTGSSDSGPERMFATVKYSPDGSELWARRLPATSLGPAPIGVAVDGAGNVVVVGPGPDPANDQFRTVKYDSGGTLQWTALSDSQAPGGFETAAAMAVDGSGHVYVTGKTGSPAPGDVGDYLTVKYSPSGTQQWTARYTGPAGLDSPYGLALDAAGAVYVVGSSQFPAGGTDYLLVKYDSGGAQQWLARYGPSSTDGYTPSRLVADDSGGVIVTGTVTAKYSSGGALQWVTTGSIRGAAVAARSGATYVAGVSTSGPNGAMFTVRYDQGGALVWSQAEPPLAGGGDLPDAIVLDADGNTYVTGGSLGTSFKDECATVKYGPGGVLLWTARYGQPGIDTVCIGLAVDGFGNVYVRGYSGGSLALKYSAEGDLLWSVQDGLDGGSASIAPDPFGNVYVAGLPLFPAPADYALVKYGPTGSLLWTALYDGPVHGTDWARALAVGPDGSAYLTGSSRGPTASGWATVKYDPNGTLVWAARRESTSGVLAEGKDLAVDASGHVYVTGRFEGDYLTVKYGPDGVEQWSARYDGPGGTVDEPKSLALGPGRVHVSGTSPGAPNGTALAVATVAYTTAGQQLWVAREEPPPGGFGTFVDLAAGPAGEAYVAWSHALDRSIVKYGPDGARQWTLRVGDPAESFTTQAIAVAPDHNLRVVGSSKASEISIDYLTVAFVEEDSVPPSGPVTLFSPDHVPGRWSNLATLGMSWSGALDDPQGSGLAGYAVQLDSSPSGEPPRLPNVPQGSDPHQWSSPPLTDGGYYFHLRACDHNDNCSATVHRGPYLVDRTFPGRATRLISTSHEVGVPSADTTIDLTWAPAQDPHSNGVASGIRGYALLVDRSAGSGCGLKVHVPQGKPTVFTSPGLSSGSWYAHVCASDQAGNWSPITTAGPFVVREDAVTLGSRAGPGAPRR